MKAKDIVIILALILLPMILGGIVLGAKTLIGGSESSGKPSFSFNQKNIGVITLEGVIYSSERIIYELKTFRDDNSIKGIIIKVNSPGGAVAPSQEIFEEILRFKEISEKPVYISMGTVAASGGYYIAAAGDRIYANSGTLTGSIGVIMQLSNYEQLLEKVGVDITTITAGELKDAGSPYRTLSTADRAYFDELLDDTHEQFILDVSRARGMKIETVEPLAEGQIFTGNMALANGLIDSIATYEQVKDAIITDLDLSFDKTDFVDLDDVNKSSWELLLESSSVLKKINTMFTPRSGVFFLAPEL